jgi:hypothetical protein
MKFIVEFHLKPGSKDKVVEIFEQQGPNRNPGVAFRGAWIGKDESIAFVLTESAEESLVANVCQAWSEYGDCEIHAVVDLEQY